MLSSRLNFPFSNRPSCPVARIRHRALGCLVLVVVLLIVAACGREEEPTKKKAVAPPAITVDWTDRTKWVDLADGWRVSRCPGERPVLCVRRDGRALGLVRLEDVPPLGEEKSESPDQVQAVLAVRIHSDYKAFVQQRLEQCGQDYEIETLRPSPVVVAGQRGLRYGATGTMAGQVMEKTVGYRVFREGIETLIEATAIRRGGCLVGEEPDFSIQELASLEQTLDRLVAGSRLPPPTRFPEPSETVKAGNVDPRMGKGPTYGIGIAR